MLLSSLSICRLVRTIRQHQGVWVDKVKNDENLRRCAFRYTNHREALEVVDGMRRLIESGGFDNKVKLTCPNHTAWPVYYVRIDARKLEDGEK